MMPVCGFTRQADLINSDYVANPDQIVATLPGNGSVTKVNLRVAWSNIDNTWSAALIGKNLANEITSVWNNDVALNGVGAYYGVMERPRSVAVQAKYNV